MKYVISDADGEMVSRVELSCRPGVPVDCRVRFSTSQGLLFGDREAAELTRLFICDVVAGDLEEALEVKEFPSV